MALALAVAAAEHTEPLAPPQVPPRKPPAATEAPASEEPAVTEAPPNRRETAQKDRVASMIELVLSLKGQAGTGTL